MTFTPPTWLKTSRLICYVPDRTIFEPQRRITFRNAQPHLLDQQEQAYPLAQCEPLQLHHIDGVAVYVTENSILSVYRDHAALSKTGKAGFVVSDGIRKVGVRIVTDKSLKAAQSLAQAFNGLITYTEEV